MNIKVRKMATPLAVILLAIIGAFAGTKANSESTTAMDQLGYRFQGAKCVPTNVICSTEWNEHICTEVLGNTLYELNGTQCSTTLYKRVIP